MSSHRPLSIKDVFIISFCVLCIITIVYHLRPISTDDEKQNMELIITGTVDGKPCAYDIWLDGKLMLTQDNCSQ